MTGLSRRHFRGGPDYPGREPGLRLEVRAGEPARLFSMAGERCCPCPGPVPARRARPRAQHVPGRPA